MCVFCKIISGEFSSYKIYEDDHCLAFLDLAPTQIGHTLVVPKEHCENLLLESPETVAHLFQAAQKVARLLMDKLHCDGINVVNNCQAAAGQAVFHTHVHVIPRFGGDNVVLNHPSENASPEDLKQIQEKILA